MAHEPVVLTDAVTGCTARVLPTAGFNCYSFQPVVEGVAHEVFWSDPGLLSGESRSIRSGLPILFPFAGRLRGTRFDYEGREFAAESLDPQGRNAIHGFVMERPWRVLAQTGNRVTGCFQASIDAPELLERWPADFDITVCHELHGNRLNCRFSIRNPGEDTLPFALGTHGYFRLPLGINSSAAQCVVTVPASQYWELEDLLPTGHRLPATGSRDLAVGLRFGAAALDDVFTGLQSINGKVTATIDDPLARRQLSLTFDPSFSECVVFKPPHGEAICIEPYTSVPDALALEHQGITTGLRYLSVGEAFETHMSLELHP